MTSNRTINQVAAKVIKGKVFEIREGAALIGQIIKHDRPFSPWVVRLASGNRVEFPRKGEAFSFANNCWSSVTAEAA